MRLPRLRVVLLHRSGLLRGLHAQGTHRGHRKKFVEVGRAARVVPRGGAAAPNDNQTIPADRVPLPEAVEERHPIQDLEPDF